MTLQHHAPASPAPSAAPAPLLAVRNVEVVYDEVILVLRGLSLYVPAGAVVALLGAGTLIAFLVMLLDGAITNWLAALIVALVLLALAAGLVLAGRNRLRRATPPAQQTVETVKEDVQWAKSQTRSAQR